MKTLAELLKNHPIPGIREAEIRRTCALTIAKVLSIDVAPKHIHLQDGVLTISLPPVVRSAVLVRAENVKTLLQEEGITVSSIR